MSRYTLARGVHSDLREIWDYVAIKNRSPDAADRLIDRIIDAFATLARQPLRGQERSDLAPRLRIFIVSPYLVLYTPEKHGVRVVQVVHSARDLPAALQRHRLK